MRRKNWVMPGILMLSVLLLLSFPVIAMAEENAVTEPTVVNEGTAAEVSTTETIADEVKPADHQIAEAPPAAVDTAVDQDTSVKDEETVAPEAASPQEPEVVGDIKDEEPAVGNNDVSDTPSNSDTGKKPDEAVVEEPTSEDPSVENPSVEVPGDTVIDEDDPQPIPIQPDDGNQSNQGEEPVTVPPVCGLPSTTEPIADGTQSGEPVITEPDYNQAPDEAGANSGTVCPNQTTPQDWTEPVITNDTGTGSYNNSNSSSNNSNNNNSNNNNSNNNTNSNTGNNTGSTNGTTSTNTGSASESGTNETAAPPETPFVTYRVRKGESLWLIGRNFGVDYLEIMKANNLKDYLIYPDQELIIPGVNTQDGKVVYRIKMGDTFYLIGKALGIDYQDIMKLNGYDDIWIYPGETLLLPEKTETAALLSTTAEAKAIIAPVGSDLELLARAIYAEARGESFEGQVAVGAVILNRLEAAGFPKSIKDIIYESGAFTAVDDGQINLTPDAEAFSAAQEALNGADPSLGALYYWNPDIATSSWIWSRPIIKQIGNHVFAR